MIVRERLNSQASCLCTTQHPRCCRTSLCPQICGRRSQDFGPRTVALWYRKYSPVSGWLLGRSSCDGCSALSSTGWFGRSDRGRRRRRERPTLSLWRLPRSSPLESCSAPAHSVRCWQTRSMSSSSPSGFYSSSISLTRLFSAPLPYSLRRSVLRSALGCGTIGERSRGGCGGENVVKDEVSGMLMVGEDQLGVGDIVDLGTPTGVVEDVRLRTTTVRDVNGALWFVRNGEITRVGNMSQGWARVILDLSVPYGADLDTVE